jgi:hypothetical protein
VEVIEACHLKSTGKIGHGERFSSFLGRIMMGKYFIAWLLGVPAFVLIIIYLLMN